MNCLRSHTFIEKVKQIVDREAAENSYLLKPRRERMLPRQR